MWILIFVLHVLYMGFLGVHASVQATPGSFVATECYGSVLSLSCRAGHRIKVLDDFFGLSGRSGGPEACRYHPGDCTVTNHRFTSVVHRYCEGKQACTSFQVDRRYCGLNQTNYEQVEYECVPDSDVTNICTSTSYTADAGYIATPNFPNEYPPGLDCQCRLAVEGEDARIQLEATHFIVKYDSPCRDWLQIAMGSRTRRLCGAYRSTLRATAFNLTFHSDLTEGHQGVWLHFSVYPWTLNASITVDCEPLIITTTAPTTAVTSSDVNTTEDDFITGYLTGDANTFSDDVTESGSYTTQANVIRPISKTNDVIVKNKTINSKTSNDVNWGLVPAVFTSGTAKRRPPGRPTKRPPEVTTKDSNSNKVARVPNEETRSSNRTTGIIIISICVGGIVLLIVILAVLLCISKRRRPKRQAEKERKRRLQQRLNSLSFYDSIPLYDSIGRKGGVGVPRSPPVPPLPSFPPPEGGSVYAHGASPEAPQSLDPSTLPWGQTDGPYWVNMVEGESDRDSAIYAELDKQSRDGISEACTTPSSSPRRSMPNGEGPPGYALHLKNGTDKNEDIYTHV